MRSRIVSVFSVALALTFGVAVATSAGRPTTLTGTAEWSGQATTIHGTFSGKLGRGTYAGTLNSGDPFTSSDCGPVCAPVTGTITFSSSRGDFTARVQPQSVVALEEIASHSFRDFTLELAIVSGTRGYAHARGTLVLSYESTWEHETVDGVFVNVISDLGTLSGNPHLG